MSATNICKTGSSFVSSSWSEAKFPCNEILAILANIYLFKVNTIDTLEMEYFQS